MSDLTARYVRSKLVARFVVRSTALTRSITPKDRLRHEPGDEMEIVGIKTVAEGALIEFTTAERSDT